MSRIKEYIYKVYKVGKELPGVATAAHFIYNRILPLCNKKTWPYKYKSTEEALQPKENRPKYLKDITMAIICDEMTYAGFEKECHCIYLTPNNWMKQLREHTPDLLFCEATWHGIKQYPECWRGRIYKNNKICFENRKDLLNILDFCKKSSIPTVFWNKEDPVYFNHKEQDFVCTALLFDYIYTTSTECVDLYKSLGHKKVGELMFGFSPKLFNPFGYKGQKNEAIFAGSWYADQEERCKDMKKLFTQILDKNINLKVYNRHSDSSNPMHQFPSEFRRYVKPSVGFGQLNEYFKQAQFGVNINTVKDSSTMFARRVFEMMASNLIVVSNDSKGIKQLFGERVWFIDEPFDLAQIESYREENLKTVFLNHTCRQRLAQIFKEIQVLDSIHTEPIYIIYNASMESQEHFKQIEYDNKVGLVNKQGYFHDLFSGQVIKEDQISSEGYIIWIEDTTHIPDIGFMKTHFEYINDNYGVSYKGEKYTVENNNDNKDSLFKVKMLNQIQKEELIPKYFI